MSALAQDAPRGFVSKQEHYAALRRIDELEAELREAKESLERLHIAAVGGERPIDRLRLALGFAPQEAAMVAYLWARANRWCTGEEIRRHLGCPNTAQVSVLRWKINQKSRCGEVLVRSVAGPRGGYGLTDKGRVWIGQEAGLKP